jgi:hypothetical protein
MTRASSYGRGPDRPPVPQNGDAVGHAEDLVELVRDVDHPDAALAQAAEDVEERLDFGLGQRGRRLV